MSFSVLDQDELINWLEEKQKKASNKATDLHVRRQDLDRLQVEARIYQEILNKIKSLAKAN